MKGNTEDVYLSSCLPGMSICGTRMIRRGIGERVPGHWTFIRKGFYLGFPAVSVGWERRGDKY